MIWPDLESLLQLHTDSGWSQPGISLSLVRARCCLKASPRALHKVQFGLPHKPYRLLSGQWGCLHGSSRIQEQVLQGSKSCIRHGFRGHTASFLPHPIGCKQIISPLRFIRSVDSISCWRVAKKVLEEHVRLEILPQPSLEKCKIQSATSQKGEDILENQKCHLQCLKCTTIIHLMQRTIHNVIVAYRKLKSIAAYSNSERLALCSHKNDPNICPCLLQV